VNPAMKPAMQVTVNGVRQDVAEGCTVEDLLDQLGRNRPGVAVAVDGSVVPRTDWIRTTLSDGSVVEVLAAVQGG
jgi:sulfur carrier protein